MRSYLLLELTSLVEFPYPDEQRIVFEQFATVELTAAVVTLTVAAKKMTLSSCLRFVKFGSVESSLTEVVLAIVALFVLFVSFQIQLIVSAEKIHRQSKLPLNSFLLPDDVVEVTNVVS